MASDTNSEIQEEEKYIQFSFKVQDELARKIDKHLHLLKYLNHNRKSKQQWINEALVEKTKRDQESLSDSLAKEKQLTVRIDPRLNTKIEKNVDLIKCFKSGFSKKLWVIEAVEQKLMREEAEAKKLLHETTQSHS